MWVVISLLNPAYELTSSAEGFTVLQQIPHIEWLPITVDPLRTAKMGIILFSALAMGIVFPLARIPRRTAIQCLAAIYCNAAILACLGIIAKLSKTPDLWGAMLEHEGYFSVFRYYNHWSQYALLALATGVALCAYYLRSEPDPLANRNSPLWLIAGALFFPALSIPLSGSRSGTALLVIFTVALICWIIYRRYRPMQHNTVGKKRYIHIAAALLILVGIGAYFYQISEKVLAPRWDTTIQQWKQVSEQGKPLGRYLIHAGTWNMIEERPVLGWGLGSFVYVFPKYAPEDLLDEKNNTRWYIEFAHQDWLQYLSELGLIGFILLIIPPICYLASPILKLAKDKNRYRNDRLGQCVMWLGVGIAILLLWAMWDFPLSNPAILAQVSVTCAIVGRLSSASHRFRS